MISKSQSTDLLPYFQNYINLVTEVDLTEALENTKENTIQLFSSIPIEKENFSYALNKWSIKQVLQHLIDSERIFAYRSLRFSRNDGIELAGYEDDLYVENSNAKNRSLKELIEEFNVVRTSSILLYKSLTEEMLDFKGMANGNSSSARIYGWITAGHTIHHCNVIEQKYL